jgi:hypothetical protein
MWLRKGCFDHDDDGGGNDDGVIVVVVVMMMHILCFHPSSHITSRSGDKSKHKLQHRNAFKPFPLQMLNMAAISTG